ncbi:sigma-54-dependent transcriptional regulator [Verrucomicrobiota bacterium]
MSRILLVDNEANILSVLSTLLNAEGYEVVSTLDGAKAKELMKSETFDLMISDIRMSPVGGMELLEFACSEYPEISVIMLTAYGTIETAIEALKLGAFDYVTKPFKVDELVITIRRALEYKSALSENMNLKAQLKTKYRFENIVAESPSMKSACEMIERVAPTDTTVLIYGESGTGKELVAKAIRAYSNRSNKEFLAVNCAALPEPLLESEMFGHVKGSFTGASSDKKGLFEAAEGGIIFLDEIGAMPLSIQGKLLRVLQEKEVRRVGGNEHIPVNARILAATNTRLEELVQSGRFREDLYYRLSVIPITIEPLRKRKEDIMPLVYHVMRQELGPNKKTPLIDLEVERILESYAWPGNVRELENAIKHALTFATGNKITRDVLPPKILNVVGDVHVASDPGEECGYRFKSLKKFLQVKEQEYLTQVVKALAGDKEKAAEALRISLATLYRKLPKGEGKEEEALPPESGPENKSEDES